jgi:hypothetical protein
VLGFLKIKYFYLQKKQKAKSKKQKSEKSEKSKKKSKNGAPPGIEPTPSLAAHYNMPLDHTSITTSGHICSEVS